MIKKLLASAAVASLTWSSVSGADTALVEPHILAMIEAGQPMEMEYNIKASAWVLILPITGKANFRVTMNKDTYAIRSLVKTTGLADILVNYDLEIAASGYTSPEGLDTYAFVSQNKDGKKNRRVDLEYLKDDLDGIKLINQGDVSKIKSTLRSKLDEVFGIQETSLVDHIWILLVPITGCFKRAKGKKLIRHNLIEVVEQFWSSDTDQTWRRDSSADRLSLLKNMGYGANEAKAIRALVTPEALQVSGKPSKKELERYRDQILAKDLSWLKELFL